jgi:hypothetical protein
MTVIRGNEVLTINGVRVAKQGVAPLRRDITSDQAALVTKNNGMDELILGVKDDNGKTQRVIVYGRDLDMSFRHQREVPDIRINGRRATLIHYDDEMTGTSQRGVRGFTNGVRDAMDTITVVARRAVEGAGFAGAGAFIGGTIWVVASKGAALEIIKNAAIVLAPKIAVGIGATALFGMGVMVVSGLLKSLVGGPADPRMETIAAVIDDGADTSAQPPAERPIVVPRPYLPPVQVPPFPVPVQPRPFNQVRPMTESQSEVAPSRKPVDEILDDPLVRETLQRLPVRLRAN